MSCSLLYSTEDDGRAVVEAQTAVDGSWKGQPNLRRSRETQSMLETLYNIGSNFTGSVWGINKVWMAMPL